MDKPKAMEEKYQDVGQEKVAANRGYVTQRQEFILMRVLKIS